MRGRIVGPARKIHIPAFFPEGDTSSPGDSEWRSLQKYAHILFVANGNKPCPAFPEGSEPLVGDSEIRLYQKLDALKA